MGAWHYLESFCHLGPRGSGTEGERRAAAWLAEQLTALGYAVETQSFRSPRHTLYLGPAAVIAGMLLARALASWHAPLGLAVMILVLVPLVGEMLGARLNFDLILPKGPSQNVLARLQPSVVPSTSAPGEPQVAAAEGKPDPGAKTVVIVAHYDTQRGTWLFLPGFRPWLRPFFVTVYVALALVPLGTAMGWAFPWAGWLVRVVDGAAMWLLATFVFLVLAWATGRYVQGANDNGSGVAVALALAQRWRQAPIPGLNPVFLFTGCEESGTRGMRHFLRSTPLPPGTVFLNLDNVGGGRLRYLRGEGMLLYHRYDPELVATVQRLAPAVSSAILPLDNLLLPTDALPATVAGFPAITLLAAGEGGAIPNYHWHTDVLQRVDREVVELTEAFAWALLQALGQRSAD